MFDPTAFENMKVVIEGHLYDRDLDGEIKIVDRNDIMNLAKLSREYSIKYCMNNPDQKAFAIFTLKAGLENLASELLPTSETKKIGCYVLLEFILHHPNEQELFKTIQNEFVKIWGEGRSIQQKVIIDPFQDNIQIQNRIIIDFQRMITEDHIDDLIEMVHPMLKTLSMLDTIK